MHKALRGSASGLFIEQLRCARRFFGQFPIPVPENPRGSAAHAGMAVGDARSFLVIFFLRNPGPAPSVLAVSSRNRELYECTHLQRPGPGQSGWLSNNLVMAQVTKGEGRLLYTHRGAVSRKHVAANFS